MTSAVTRPGTDTVIGLGYVKKAHAKPGVTLSLGRDRGAIEAVVEELPFKPAESQALPSPGRPHRPPRSPVRGSSAASGVHRKATTRAMSSGLSPLPASVCSPAASISSRLGKESNASVSHVPTGNGVDGYPLGGQLDGQIPGYGLQRRLRSPDRKVVGEHPLGPLAGDVDDASAVEHQPRGLDGTQPRGPGVDVHGPVPVLCVQLRGRTLNA